MTERPIIFSGPMVRAILAGRKTQTRRLVTNHDRYGCLTGDCPHDHKGKCQLSLVLQCPYGMATEQLWVRETHAGDNCCGWVYRADHPDADIRAGDLDDGEQSLRRWTPSIHMKREACRLRLEVTGVRVERLQDITIADAEAEGVMERGNTARVAYASLWDSLNAKRAPWASNPWVWVVEFKRGTA